MIWRLTPYKIHTVVYLGWFILTILRVFFDFSWCESDTHSVETMIRILNFDLFLDRRCGVDTLVILGSGNRSSPSAPGSRG